jgi:hypothetical protein
LLLGVRCACQQQRSYGDSRSRANHELLPRLFC